MTDNMTKPEYDDKLWFTTPGCPGHHFLVGNAHTFHGRIAAWCPRDKREHNVSKKEIIECSREAEYWLQGFLVGNEPDGPRDEDGDYLEADDPRMQRWWAAIDLFHETGYWWAGEERRCSICGTALLPSHAIDTCARCMTSDAV